MGVPTALIFTAAPILFAVFGGTEEEMWRTGTDEFTAQRFSSLKAHLRSGGEIWPGFDKDKSHITAVVKQGARDHSRTTKE